MKEIAFVAVTSIALIAAAPIDDAGDTFLLPTVVSALVSLLTVILAPTIAGRIKRRSQDRIESTSLQIRKIDGQEKFYEDLIEELERIRASLSEAQSGNIELERRILAVESDRLLLETELRAVASDVEEMRQMVDEHLADHPEAGALSELAVRVLDRIRRGQERAG